MSRGGNRNLFQPPEGLEALRAITIHLREDRGLSRAEIAKLAGLSPTDVDNFTIFDRRAPNPIPKFKSRVPRPEFQRRLTNFILANETTKLHINRGEPGVAEQYLRLKESAATLESPGSANPLFDSLVKAGALRSEKDSRRILDRLAGNYYCYRNARIGNRVIKGHIHIPPYNVYSKTPSFVHRRLDDNNSKLIISQGAIMEIGDKYVFNGFVYGSHEDTSAVLGIKLMVINRGSKERNFEGIYLCSDISSTYEFGRLKMVRTDDKFDQSKILTAHFTEMTDINYKYLFLSPRNWHDSITEVKSAIECSFDINHEERLSQERTLAVRRN